MPESPAAPESTTEWRPDFGAEGNARVDQGVEKGRTEVSFTLALRRALGLSPAEFHEFLQQDDQVGLPPDVPRSYLTIFKLRDFLEAHGGGALTISFHMNNVDYELEL